MYKLLLYLIIVKSEKIFVISSFLVEIKRTIFQEIARSKDFRTKKVFVGGIPTVMDEGETSYIFFKIYYKYHVFYTIILYEFKGLFSKYGKVTDFDIIQDHVSKIGMLGNLVSFIQ
uniref:RRM domain-containing protein n=1 Tax=Solanum lycopersicum TaxID=4081 RepID=A0A3Q7G875_SOLLC